MSAGSGSDRCGAFGTTTGRVCVLKADHDGEHQLTRSREDDELLASLRNANNVLRRQIDRLRSRSNS
jgi:hypothetical protein